VADTPPSNKEPTAAQANAPVRRRTRRWVIGSVIVLMLGILLAVLNPLRGNRDERALTDLGLIKGACNEGNGAASRPDAGCVAWRAKPTLSTSELAAAVPHLGNLHLRLELSLAGTEVDNLESLSALDSLEALDLTDTHIWNIDALKGLHALKRLVVHRTDVENIGALKGLTGLQSLNLWDTRVSNLDALKDLTNLQQLDLRDTQVRDLDILQKLPHLDTLKLGGARNVRERNPAVCYVYF